MNKKIFIVIVGILVIGLIGGGFYLMTRNNEKLDNSSNTQDNSQNQEQENNSTQNNEDNNIIQDDNDNENIDSNKNIAIIYFSATGITKKMAEYIKNTTNGDLIEIIPKEKYTDSDLNYGNDNSRANKEQNDSNARPEISNNINTDNYDVIYLGYPIWWGDVPKIILTFLDSHNLNGKTIIPFCTSHSSGISASLNTLKNYNKNINWIDGKRFDSGTSQNEVTNWVNSIRY